MLIFGKIENTEIKFVKGVCMQCQEIDSVDHFSGLCKKCKTANEWDEVRGKFGGNNEKN